MADPRKALEELLESLGESAQFATSGSMAPVLPGLEVNGIGTIGTPVSAADAKRLIAKATQAPYGRGEQTIVDTNVRRVWQIEPSEFRLENPEWEDHIAAIVEAVKNDFGIQQKVNAELYKLLVYEPGSFFAPHRDTEKTRNMFGTLVVCLPSRHEGGALIVRHDSQTERINFGGKDSQFKTQYAAFYADCQHEIEPVTFGYRIGLVYNLATAGKRQPSAPESSAAVSKAARLLQSLFAEASSQLDKIAIPFKHQYTEAGFNPAQLKGSDRSRADVLVRAAESMDYACYLALLTHWQSGLPDYSPMARYPRGRPRYGRSYDEDDDEASDESQLDFEEVYEEELSLDHWVDPQGQEQRLGEIHLEENEILTLGNREGWSHRQEYHEATGNEGATIDRWYRQGVVVIWPRDHTFRILAGEGQHTALPELEHMLRHSKKAEALADCRSFAAEIINLWNPRLRPPEGEAAYPLRMLEILDRLDAADLAERFVRDVLPKDFDGSEGTALLRPCERFGWERFRPALRNLVDQQKPDDYFASLASIVALCRPLCCDPPLLTDKRRAVCLELADALRRAIERWDTKPASSYDDEELYDDAGESRAGVVDGALHVFSSLLADEHLDWFIAHILADKRRYSLHKVLIPDVKAIHRWLSNVPQARPAAARLLEHCRFELRAATAHPIEPPKDWSREAKLDCNCEDCQALSRFLRDPTQRVGRFPIRKERRQHLHQQIQRHGCDCTHVTERRGSPQTLVCTKTQSSYERRLAQYDTDQQLLAELNELAETGAPPPPHLQRTRRSSRTKKQ